MRLRHLFFLHVGGRGDCDPPLLSLTPCQDNDLSGALPLAITFLHLSQARIWISKHINPFGIGKCQIALTTVFLFCFLIYLVKPCKNKTARMQDVHHYIRVYFFLYFFMVFPSYFCIVLSSVSCLYTHTPAHTHTPKHTYTHTHTQKHVHKHMPNVLSSIYKQC